MGTITAKSGVLNAKGSNQGETLIDQQKKNLDYCCAGDGVGMHPSQDDRSASADEHLCAGDDRRPYDHLSADRGTLSAASSENGIWSDELLKE
jgi:hypothetical protein